MKRVLLIILCVLLLAGGVFMLVSTIAAQRFEKEPLEDCCVSTGGGMLGGMHEVRLFKDENGDAALSVCEKETHADREITTTYKVDTAAFAHVRELVVRHRLYSASKRPYSKMRVLDGDTTSVSFSFAKDWFRVSEEQMMSPKMREGFRAVIAYLSSLANGEGVTTKAPQTGMLYLKSGYTLQFIVEDVFDGRLDDILGKEHEVSAFKNSGIVLAEGERPNLADAEAVKAASAGSIVYSAEDDCIVVLHEDASFPQGAYVLAVLDGYVPSAAPLIKEMQGEYKLFLN